MSSKSRALTLTAFHKGLVSPLNFAYNIELGKFMGEKRIEPAYGE